MNAESDFSERTLTNQFDKLVELQSGRREFVVLLNVTFDEFD